MSEDNSNRTRGEIEEDDDDEPIYVTLEYDDGTVMETEVLGTFEVDGKEYIAVIPDDGSDDVYIYGYEEVEGSDGEYDFIDIKDDKEFDRVVEAFDELMAGQE